MMAGPRPARGSSAAGREGPWQSGQALGVAGHHAQGGARPRRGHRGDPGGAGLRRRRDRAPARERRSGPMSAAAASGTTSPHHVVIVGGGFGGLTAAQTLRHAPVRITLLDRRNFHLFQPLLYQVATGNLSNAHIAWPLRAILRRQANVQVLLAEVRDIDAQNRRVILEDGAIDYDTLVVAAGASHSYFGHDEWRDRAPGLKSIEDAVEIRRRIFLAFEAAERCADDEARAALAHVRDRGRRAHRRGAGRGPRRDRPSRPPPRLPHHRSDARHHPARGGCRPPPPAVRSPPVRQGGGGPDRHGRDRQDGRDGDRDHARGRRVSDRPDDGARARRGPSSGPPGFRPRRWPG